MYALVIIYCQLVPTTLDVSNHVLCSESILNPHKRKGHILSRPGMCYLQNEQIQRDPQCIKQHLLMFNN